MKNQDFIFQKSHLWRSKKSLLLKWRGCVHWRNHKHIGWLERLQIRRPQYGTNRSENLYLDYNYIFLFIDPSSQMNSRWAVVWTKLRWPSTPAYMFPHIDERGGEVYTIWVERHSIIDAKLTSPILSHMKAYSTFFYHFCEHRRGGGAKPVLLY